jgi:glycosyltransferase involved in cell wall biosynthesis
VRAELGIEAGECVVGIVGRLTAIKNHAMFLEAARMALDRAPAGLRLRFLVVGGGDLEREVRDRAASLGLGDRAVFAGWRRDLAAVYTACDVVALTSNNEGTPVAVIEALASGRPVVSTDVGGVSDVLEGGRFGLLVPPGDASAFADALVRVASDAGLRERLLAGARASALERFSIEALAGRVDALYADLLDGRAR